MKKFSRIISLIVVIATIMTLLTGCGEAKKAEKTVEKTFKALQKLDIETASSYINVDEIMESDEDSLSADDDILMENLFGKLEYEIVSSEKIDKNTVVVKTKITTIAMESVLGEYFLKIMEYSFANIFANPQPTDEEMDEKAKEILSECFAKEDLEKLTSEVEIKVVKVDKQWKIESSDALADALLGGLMQAAEDLANSFGE